VQGELAQAREIDALTINAVRASYRAAAEQGGPNAQAFLRKHESAINSLGDEAIKLQGLTDQLVAAEAAKLGAQKGTLARFAAADPQVGIRRVFTSANPAETAGEIITKFQKALDVDALKGFQREVLAELFRRDNYSAVSLKSDLESARNLRLIKSLQLPDSVSKRLGEIIDMAAKVETGDLLVPGVTIPTLGPVLGLVTRFIGAGLGRDVVAFTGKPATIQQTAAAATFSKAFVHRLLGKLDPADAFALAVTNPAFEKIMLTRAPTTTKEFKAFSSQIRVFLGTEATLRKTVEKKKPKPAAKPKAPIEPPPDDPGAALVVPGP